MGCYCCVVCEEEVTQAPQLDYSLGSLSGKVEELSVCPGSEIDTFGCRTKCVFQHQSKEDSKQGGSQDADVEPSKTTVPFMSSWKDLMMLRSLGGHPILRRILKRPSLLTRSKAFVRSIKATEGGCLCSLHFSWSCLSEKIMSTVDLLARKPHCDSG